MRAPSLILLLAGTVGCSANGDGTAVGNPGHLDVYVEGVPDDVSLDSALFRVAAIELVSCDNDVEILQLDTTFDALAPSPVEIPGGEWCRTVVLPDGKDSFLLEGTDALGEPFVLGLSPDPFLLEGRYVIDGNQVVIALALAKATTDTLTGNENDPAAEPVDDNTFFEPDLIVPSGLFEDVDADGRADSGAPLATYSESANGCGCRTGASPGGPLILLAGMLGWLARRPRPRRPASDRWPSTTSS